MTHGKTDGENLPCFMGQPTSAEMEESSIIHGATDIGSERKCWYGRVLQKIKMSMSMSCHLDSTETHFRRTSASSGDEWHPT